MSILRTAAKSLVPPAARDKLRQAYESVEPLLYAGNDVLCPCCGATFREFLPHGPRSRKNARCAKCNALERHRLLYLYMKERTNLLTDRLRVLHFAPEDFFRNLLRSQQNLTYVTGDLSPELADTAMDITQIPVRDSTFDVVLCNHVLEHIPDDHKAMTELCRVLKPNGWAILQVPIDVKRETTYEDWTITSPEDRHLHFGQFDHVRWYGLDYKDRLARAGFTVKVDQYVQELGPEKIRRYGLTDWEDIYYCTKS